MSNLQFYRGHYQRLAPAMFSLMRRGVRVDLDKAAQLRTALRGRCAEIQEDLAHLIGADLCTCGHYLDDHPEKQVNVLEGVLKKDGKPRKPRWKMMRPCCQQQSDHECANFTPTHAPLHGKKDLSSAKVSKYIYGELGLPPQRIQRGGITANEVALRKLILRCLKQEKKPSPKSTMLWKRDPTFCIKVLKGVLQHRERAKLSGYVDEGVFDIDGRLRCTYKVTTDPGRLASSKNPFGTGLNLQNLPRPGKEGHTHIRKILLPERGLIWWGVDYSQAENRIVKVLTKDPKYIREARLRPLEFDTYIAAAKRVFSQLLGIPEDEVDVKEEVVPGTTRRQIIKPVCLGVPYGEGVGKILEQFLKDEVVISQQLCEQLLALTGEQPIRDFQQETRIRIWHDRRLVNSWGRVLDFTHCRMDGNTYRRGYAFRGASENADNLNQLGFIPAYLHCLRERLRTCVQMQVHDEIAGSTHPGEVYDFFRFLRRSMEETREYEGVELSIPITYKLGVNAMCDEGSGEGIEWKELPSRKVVEEKAWELLEKCEVRDGTGVVVDLGRKIA